MGFEPSGRRGFLVLHQVSNGESSRQPDSQVHMVRNTSRPVTFAAGVTGDRGPDTRGVWAHVGVQQSVAVPLGLKMTWMRTRLSDCGIHKSWAKGPLHTSLTTSTRMKTRCWRSTLRPPTSLKTSCSPLLTFLVTCPRNFLRNSYDEHPTHQNLS